MAIPRIIKYRINLRLEFSTVELSTSGVELNGHFPMLLIAMISKGICNEQKPILQGR